MKHVLGISTIFLASLLYITPSHALLFSDPYGVGSPDVIGNISQFDLHSVELVTLDYSLPGQAEFNISMNYNNGSLSLNPFSIAGITLSAGDLLFQGATSYWGIALNSDGHGSIVAGNLYQANGFLTAQTVLGNPSGVTYRPTEAVWFDPNGATQQGMGSITTSSLGGPEVNVNVKFLTSAAFLNDSSGGYNILMATATCGNDILRAAVNVPEPSSWLLLLLGLPAIAWFNRFAVQQPR
jgi:PEP-CTERM motif